MLPLVINTIITPCGPIISATINHIYLLHQPLSSPILTTHLMKEGSDTGILILAVYAFVGKEIDKRAEEVATHLALQDHVTFIEQHLPNL